MRIVGELADVDQLVVDAHGREARAEAVRLRGSPTRGQSVVAQPARRRDQPAAASGRRHRAGVGGAIRLARQPRSPSKRPAKPTSGILQAFFRNIRSSGTASLLGQIRGPLDKPVFSGNATISTADSATSPRRTACRKSTVASPSTRRASASWTTGAPRRRCSEVRRTHRSQRIYSRPDLTANGEQMHLRYPEGFRSIVDADPWLRGDAARVLGGTVTSRTAARPGGSKRNVDIFAFGGGGLSCRPARPPPRRCRSASTSRSARPTRCASRTTSRDIDARADLTLKGTYDNPVVFGRAEIERGRSVRRQPLRRHPRDH